MGTDRIEVFRGPCTCGRGEYAVDECTPDHPYARAHQIWWDTAITCPDCAAQFSLVDRGGTICRVRRSDQAAAAQAQNTWSKRVNQIETSAETAGHYAALGEWLRSFPSVAAVHRAVAGLVSSTTVATFRKHYSRSDPAGWARRNIFYRNLPVALARISRSDPNLEQQIKDADAQPKSADVPTLEVVYQAK